MAQLKRMDSTAGDAEVKTLVLALKSGSQDAKAEAASKLRAIAENERSIVRANQALRAG